MTMPAALLDPDASRRLQAELLQLMEHQRVLYRRLSALAEQQRTLVVAEDPQPLLALLAERQRLVDGLTGLNLKLAPYRRHWTRVYTALDAAARKRVTELVDEANRTLSLILHNDGRDCQTLSVRRQSTAERLSEIDAVGRANAAYATAGATESMALTDAQG